MNMGVGCDAMTAGTQDDTLRPMPPQGGGLAVFGLQPVDSVRGPDERVVPARAKVHEMLARGEAPSEEFRRPEIAAALLDAAARQGP
jgi:hypothetical protein